VSRVLEQRAPVSAGPTGAHRVLVVGAARSGTTWVAELLGRTTDASYVHEPDNFDWVPFAGRARARLGLLPNIEVGQDPPPAYARLWDQAFASRRPSLLNRVAVRAYASIPGDEKYAALAPDGSRSLRLGLTTRLARPAAADAEHAHHVVKSVSVPLALEWLVARFDPDVVMVRRHPLDVLASRVGFGTMFLQNALSYLDDRAVATRLERWGSPPRPSDGDRFAHFVWLAGFTISAYDEVAEAHPEFQVVDHERLCADPVPEFRRLVGAAGLEWSEDCEEYLQSSNTPGSGFETKRVLGAQSGTWHTRLSPEQLETARHILSQFPLAGRYPELS